MISVVIAATWMNLGGAGLFRKIRHVTIPQTRLILSMLLLLQILAPTPITIRVGAFRSASKSCR